MNNSISSASLKSFIENVFLAAGFSEEHALASAEVLISADLRGIDSHGVARLPGYIRLIKKGRINTNPNIKITRETLSTSNFNADEAIGLVAGQIAMQEAIRKAQEVGSAWVTVHNSNHFGIAGFYTMMAAQEECIGIAMTNASPLVAPVNSKERLLGTNPISIAYPAKSYPPIVVDMATSAAANGKLEIAQRKNQQIPGGWAQDQEGNETNNSSALKEAGALRPLGSYPETGSHKGFALGAAVDLFSGVLSGAGFGPWVPPFVDFLEPKIHPKGKGIGHIFCAMRIDAFREKTDYYEAIDAWIERFQNAESIDGSKLMVPGEPELLHQKNRLENGIELNEKVYEEMQALSKEFGVAL